jgi:hypothetical protein
VRRQPHGKIGAGGPHDSKEVFGTLKNKRGRSHDSVRCRARISFVGDTVFQSRIVHRGASPGAMGKMRSKIRDRQRARRRTIEEIILSRLCRSIYVFDNYRAYPRCDPGVRAAAIHI